MDIHSASNRWTQSGPTVTKWKVIAAGSDRAMLEGDVTGVVSVTGQVFATAVIVGTRTATMSPVGVLQSATVSTSQQTLLAVPGGTTIRPGWGTSIIRIALIR